MGRKAKILIVHNYYQIPGGEDTVVANEKKLLEEHDHDVLFYSRNNSELKHFSKLQKLILPITTMFNPKTYREVKRIIRENNVDIVHVHNTLNLVSPSVYYAAFSCKIPVVQTIHNFRLLCPGATFYRDGHICEECVSKGLSCAVRHRCYRGSRLQTFVCVMSTWLHRRLGTYRKLNYIFLTEFNRNKLLLLNKLNKKQLIDPERVFVKPNFTYPAATEKKNGEHYLFIGRIEEIKGADRIAEAFSQMPDKRILFAGTGTLLEDLKEKYRDCSNVIFLGFMDRKSLDMLLSKAKAVIVDSQWYETFGMIVIEAYAAGVPVIVGDIGNVGDLVISNETGVKFRYNSTKELIDAVGIFEKADREWQDSCKYTFEKRYSPEHNIDILNSVYEEAERMYAEDVLKKHWGGVLLRDYFFGLLEVEVPA